MKKFCGCLFTLCLHGLFWFPDATAYAGSVSKRMLNGCNAKTPRPFFVRILTESNKNQHGCGGTAINPKFVLTALHCVTIKRTLDSPLQLREKITIVHADFTREENERQYTYLPLNMDERPSPVYVYNKTHKSQKSNYVENRINNLFEVDIALLRLPRKLWLKVMVLPPCEYDKIPHQFSLKIVGLGHIDMEGNRPKLLQEGNFSEATKSDLEAIGWNSETQRAHPAQHFVYDGDSDQVDKQCSGRFGDSGGPAFLVDLDKEPVCLYGVLTGIYLSNGKIPEQWSRNYNRIDKVNYVFKWIKKIVDSYVQKTTYGLQKPIVHKILGGIPKPGGFKKVHFVSEYDQ